MTIEAGTKLGRYEIQSKLGAGGMGEVYRAKDLELDRFVALKFLSDEVTHRQKAVARFTQEAKAVSALNHPNILTVYEIGRVEDHLFLATEFVDGVTLRHYLQFNRLKLTEVLDIAIQVAGALVAAHAAGIVHRDIKPENIMVRNDGIVKVLDFGLAKLTERESLWNSDSEAATLAMVNTEPGVILGTTSYMSPEQACAREVDARSDIWSLGVVLYEMVAARPPFKGATKSHIIVAITDQEPPPLTSFVPDIPEALEWIISEALTKDREERCQTARELLGKLKKLKQRLETDHVSSAYSLSNRSTSGTSLSDAYAVTTIDDVARPQTQTDPIEPMRTSSTVQPQPSKRRTAIIVTAILGSLFIAALVFSIYKLTNKPARTFGLAKLNALTTGGKISGEDINGQVSLSPDGKYVVCAANDANQKASLWIRQISTNSLVRLVPPEAGGYLATTFSTDGEQIYFVAAFEKTNFVMTLYRIPVLGGTPTKVLDRVSSAIGFSPSGKQFAFVRDNPEDMSLMIAETDGSSEPKTIAVRKKPNGFSTAGPSWSPDGEKIAIGADVADRGGFGLILEVPIQGGEPRSLGTEKWASVNRVVWLNDGSGLIMTAQEESSSAGTQVWLMPYPSGSARRITNDLSGYGAVSLGVTADSNTIATIQILNTSSVWVAEPNDDETRARQIVKTSLPETVSWTPDGKIVFASRTGENWDLWKVSYDGSSSSQLTEDAYIEQQPHACPDGRYIVFQSNRSGNRNIWRIDANGENAKQLTSGTEIDASPVCSVDGQSVVFMSSRAGKSTIWKVGIDGGTAVQLTDKVSDLPTISPDGKTIAFSFIEEQANNQPKLSLMSIDGGAITKTINLPKTVQLIAFAWTPDGKSVAYLDNSSGILNIWSQPIEGGAPKQLTNFKSEFLTSFAISREGKIAAYRFSATRDIVLIKDFK